MDYTLRTEPCRDRTNGFYIACFERVISEEDKKLLEAEEEMKKAETANKAAKKERKDMKITVKSNLNIGIMSKAIKKKGKNKSKASRRPVTS